MSWEDLAVDSRIDSAGPGCPRETLSEAVARSVAESGW